MTFGRIFPPHPALSLGERERSSPDLQEPKGHWQAVNAKSFFLSPRGEGRGEGEGRLLSAYGISRLSFLP